MKNKAFEIRRKLIICISLFSSLNVLAQFDCDPHSHLNALWRQSNPNAVYVFAVEKMSRHLTNHFTLSEKKLVSENGETVEQITYTSKRDASFKIHFYLKAIEVQNSLENPKFNAQAYGEPIASRYKIIQPWLIFLKRAQSDQSLMMEPTLGFDPRLILPWPTLYQVDVSGLHGTSFAKDQLEIVTDMRLEIPKSGHIQQKYISFHATPENSNFQSKTVRENILEFGFSKMDQSHGQTITVGTENGTVYYEHSVAQTLTSPGYYHGSGISNLLFSRLTKMLNMPEPSRFEDLKKTGDPRLHLETSQSFKRIQIVSSKSGKKKPWVFDQFEFVDVPVQLSQRSPKHYEIDVSYLTDTHDRLELNEEPLSLQFVSYHKGLEVLKFKMVAETTHNKPKTHQQFHDLKQWIRGLSSNPPTIALLMDQVKAIIGFENVSTIEITTKTYDSDALRAQDETVMSEYTHAFNFQIRGYQNTYRSNSRDAVKLSIHYVDPFSRAIQKRYGLSLYTGKKPYQKEPSLEELFHSINDQMPEENQVKPEFHQDFLDYIKLATECDESSNRELEMGQAERSENQFVVNGLFQSIIKGWPSESIEEAEATVKEILKTGEWQIIR